MPIQELELDNLRLQIDEIDNQIVNLLAQRMMHVRAIGQAKKKNNTVIYRPEREIAILERLASKSEGTLLNRSSIEAIFMQIFAASRNFELPERVAYLGPEGSFTHQAAESRFGALSDYMPLPSISSVFDSVVHSHVRFGVVPIENNQEGFVRETIDLLHEHEVRIVAEIAMPIHLAFVSKSDKLSDIKKIYSKEIAFGQAEQFIQNHFSNPDVRLVPVNSTSKAAQLAAQEPQSAAICAAVAAKLYKVPILFERIEDSAENRTRFWVISKHFENKISGNDQTILIVKLPDIAGSLVSFLQDFSDKGINLNKIESRPLRDDSRFRNWFYVEMDGHLENPDIREVVEKHQDKIRILGSCPKQPLPEPLE
ncbi:MAG: prephenate dehydratase [Bernardetiaceae bacterium]|nr:prephenate dehydratase [Bernardetiaceae bacterium]